MDKDQMNTLRLDIAFWALMTLGAVQTGWQAKASFLMGTLAFVANWLFGPPSGPGFWAKVWRR